MARSLSFFGDDTWPSDDGWPYADTGEPDVVDLVDTDAEVDEDLLTLHLAGGHVLDDLAPLERAVVEGRFGLGDGRPHSMRELQRDLGVPRADLRNALGDGLAKVRARLG